MKYALLGLLVILSIRQAEPASTKHLQKDPLPHEGAQHHGTVLPRQLPACSNLLDATELHGGWVEGPSDTEAR